MCGIVGVFSFSTNSPPDVATVQRMGECLRHRGPDQAGLYHEGLVCLGHRRLSIIDLSEAANQPMPNEDRSLWIVFNGEIYNYQELRPGLERSGHQFRSNSDTEVILHLYEAEGEACLEKLRGMFAFAIWDLREERLFLARDRLGKKPLFYYIDSQVFVFASEMKSLLLHPRISREINLKAIDEYLSYQYVPAPKTIFKGIQKLLPGHYLRCRQHQLDVQRYWKPDFSVKNLYRSPSDLEAEVLNQLEEATRVRLKSDVPLGAFLSGGVDSSAVVAMMAKVMNRPVNTFSIGFDEDDYSELSYGRKIANLFQTNHHEFIVKPDAVGILPKLVWHYDEPYSDSSALPTYCLSQMTRQHVTVALNGDGGDECFAGYEKYIALWLLAYVNRLPGGTQRILQSLGRLLPEQVQKRNLLRKFKRFLHTSSGDFKKDYLALMTLFDDASKALLYSPDFFHILNEYPMGNKFLADLLDSDSALHWVDRVSTADYASYLPNDLLVKVDIASMAHSLELRSPFLDHKFVEFSARLSPEFKLRGTTTKYILKRALRKILPADVLHRKKMGFGVPLNHWFRGPLQVFARETLLCERSLRRRYFQPEYVRRLLTEHIEGKRDHAYKLWNLLVLEIWHQVYVDGPPPTTQPSRL